MKERFIRVKIAFFAFMAAWFLQVWMNGGDNWLLALSILNIFVMFINILDENNDKNS